MSIKGYTPLSPDQIAGMNNLKVMEEQVLRLFEHTDRTLHIDQRQMAIAKTQLEDAFMRANRSIAKPARISLPSDDDVDSDSA